jgi:hypothetical protein
MEADVSSAGDDRISPTGDDRISATGDDRNSATGDDRISATGDDRISSARLLRLPARSGAAGGSGSARGERTGEVGSFSRAGDRISAVRERRSARLRSVSRAGLGGNVADAVSTASVGSAVGGRGE